MTIERLDGFTVDGLGSVIPGDPEDGDVVRIDGRIEQRWVTPPIAPDSPAPPPPPTKQDLLDAINTLSANASQIAEQIAALSD